MKKFLFTLVMSIVALFLGTTVTSCDYIKHDCSALSSSDSVQIAIAVDKCINPSFTTVADFCKYVENETEYEQFMSVVATLHQNTVQSIAYNTLSTSPIIDYRAFMKEYISNKQLYDNVDKVNKSENVPRATMTVELDSVPPLLNNKSE